MRENFHARLNSGQSHFFSPGEGSSYSTPKVGNYGGISSFYGSPEFFSPPNSSPLHFSPPTPNEKLPGRQRGDASPSGIHGIMGLISGTPPHQLPPSALDKRFKTLLPLEALPRHEALGGYIFVCNNDTMEDNLKRQLFGLPQRYRDSVRAIQPGLPLFLYNYTSHQLHGIFEATSFGGYNIDGEAWEDKKSPKESRFPAQVCTRVRKRCKPLDEDQFRPVLHHYDGPKFRLQLSVPEAIALLDLFHEQDGPETPPLRESPIGNASGRAKSPFG